MLMFLLSIMVGLETNSVAATQEAQATAPTIRRLPNLKKCRCPEEVESDFLIIEGLVVDARVSLAPDGRSANDRQVTFFNVVREINEIEGRIPVWHSTDPAQCGVTFDYGKKYKVPVRKTIDDALETDQCLMKQLNEQFDNTFSNEL